MLWMCDILNFKIQKNVPHRKLVFVMVELDKILSSR